MCRCHWRFLKILHEPLPLFGAILLGGLLNQHVHFLLVDFNAIGLTDFGEQQAQTHAAHRDIMIVAAFSFHFLLRGFRVFLAGSFLLQLSPDLFEFGFNH